VSNSLATRITAFKIFEFDSLVPRQDKKTSTSPEKFTY
jgi:hypothetical protein